MLPKRQIKITYDYRHVVGFGDEPMTPEEQLALVSTAHIHLKVLIDKLKVIWAEGADSSEFSSNHEKWLRDKAIQAGGEKYITDLITFYSNLIDKQPKPVEKQDSQHW